MEDAEILNETEKDSQSVSYHGKDGTTSTLLYCTLFSSILSANKVKLRCCMQNKCSYIDRSIHSLSRHNPQGSFFSFTVICILQYLLHSRHCKNHAAGPSIKKSLTKKKPQRKEKEQIFTRPYTPGAKELGFLGTVASVDLGWKRILL